MEELERHMFLLRDRDATQHLMEVSGGLDSLIKGEGQILAQVFFNPSSQSRPRPPPLVHKVHYESRCQLEEWKIISVRHECLSLCTSQEWSLQNLPCFGASLHLKKRAAVLTVDIACRLQVKQVYKVGQDCEGFGRHLNGLFKQAITAGKRVRAETSIASGAVSVSSAAAELAQLKLPTQHFEDAKARAHIHHSAAKPVTKVN